MNWNNTQFDGKYPITIGCSRRVGEVMKYLTEKDPEPQISYSFTCKLVNNSGPIFSTFMGRVKFGISEGAIHERSRLTRANHS